MKAQNTETVKSLAKVATVDIATAANDTNHAHAYTNQLHVDTNHGGGNATLTLEKRDTQKSAKNVKEMQNKHKKASYMQIPLRFPPRCSLSVGEHSELFHLSAINYTIGLIKMKRKMRIQSIQKQKEYEIRGNANGRMMVQMRNDSETKMNQGGLFRGRAATDEMG